MENQTSSTTDTNTNDMEVLRKMEDEHCRLQRQVRMIQTDRQHRTMGVHPQFRRQDQLLRTLKKDYISLMTDLKIARSGAHKSRCKKMEYDLKKSILLRVKTQMECEEGVIMMEQMDGVLQGNNKEMLNLRKLVSASQGQMEMRRMQSEHRLVSTENQLEAAMLRFNAIQYENKKIREEIEHMLKDRAIFKQAWAKMMTALGKGKKFLIDLFESSTLAYDQRDEWCAKLKSLQEKGKMDQMQQVQEMRDLQKAFDHEMKLYHFLARKGVMRINKKEEQREEDRKRKEEEDLRKQFEDHVKILDEIHDYTQETDVDKIIESFELVEHQNFSKYKLLTDFCAENVVLDRSLREVRRNVEDRRDWNEMSDRKRQQKLMQLREEFEAKKKVTDGLRSKLAEREQLLNENMDKIHDIFKMLDCSQEPFQKLLGDKQPSLQQLNLTLCLISEKIKEYIQTVYYYERFIQKKSDKTSTSRLKKYTVHAEPPHFWKAAPISVLVPADPCPSCVEARWLSRVSETDEAPFDRQQAREALEALASEPAYLRSDRVHPLTECRVPRSRAILARRYLKH
ncbi:trichohyalin-like [Ostrinia furnacalis]|uniref:trichohyalin-like n=1 Tax=Ostrinia furnacalis TaxID=93504 RepID=UPI00103F67C9|nr:trichohyalin-like [Ostrinia furnacalis]